MSPDTPGFGPECMCSPLVCTRPIISATSSVVLAVAADRMALDTVLPLALALGSWIQAWRLGLGLVLIRLQHTRGETHEITQQRSCL